MNITISKLEISNFRNLKTAVFVFNDNRVAISGKNAIGKSNVIEAISWLLTGKTLTGGSDDTINKPHDDSKAIVSVKATFSKLDETMTYEKQYCEIWENERGSDESRLTGHKTTILINGVETTTQKAADTLFSNFIGYDGNLSAIINPLYIGFAPYKDIRAMIIGLAGDIANDDIFASNKVLSNYLFDDFKIDSGDISRIAKRYADEIKKRKAEIQSKNAHALFIENDADINKIRIMSSDIGKLLNDKVMALRKEVSDIKRSITSIEEKQIALDKFIAEKYKALNERIQNVFGKVRFNLIESNIKEGSYKEVCYPYIIGTDTKFENGSTSEKIITGIAVIEALKKQGGYPNMPIIFDEAEALDTKSLADKLATTSQIITAKVNDEFDTPTITKI